MKKVLITQRVDSIERIGERRDALSQEWAALAHTCGFLPLPAPNHLPTVRRMLELEGVAGVLLTGGNDLSCYGGDAPERDEVERMLIGWAVDRQQPLLGVCRGMQMLLHYFGTPLERVEGHVRTEHALDDGSLVNSFHGWAARTCNPPLTALRTAADGVVEAVGHMSYPWIHGIMWHPERYHPFRREDIEWIRGVFAL